MFLMQPNSDYERKIADKIGMYFDNEWKIKSFDKSMNRFMRLPIDFMFVNEKDIIYIIYNFLKKEQYSDIKKQTKERENYECQICGKTGAEQKTEIDGVVFHMKFEYRYHWHIQKVLNTECLCPYCHEIKHLLEKYYNTESIPEYLKKHFININKSNKKEFEEYFYFMKDERERLIRPEWVPNLNFFTNQYSTLNPMADEFYSSEDRIKIIKSLLWVLKKKEGIFDLQEEYIKMLEKEISQNEKHDISGDRAIRTKMLFEKAKARFKTIND